MPKINRKTGLPDSIKMRHDDHFVDLISSRAKETNIRYLKVGSISPNPHQARNELGEMDDLVNSIKERGVLEPILVRPKDGNYEIIAGERRYMASKKLGLETVPCIVMNVNDMEAMEISLIENLQRVDLDVFEEADGLKYLSENYGYNHEQISKRLGKARSTVTEIISISRIPDKIRNLCDEYGIKSRSTLVEISKQENEDDMERLINAIKERELKREDTRKLSREIKGTKRHKVKKYIYNYEPEGKRDCRVRIEFKKQRVRKEEIIRVLEMMLEKLKEKE
ncbi:MAG TPA: ParB/RepB/Spo0J family partition protein [Acidobacteriota bacterium]|nr:ParB/RepB/Spo0J family partition protein [Acidobacteriota bacterium]